MTLQADALVDRRRLKRRLSLWRVIAVVFAVGLVAALLMRVEGFAAAVGFKPHIARITIDGIIRDDRKQQELIEDVAKAKSVKAVILRINSPGGTTTGGESLFEAVRRLTEKKPVVSVYGTVATSAAYMVSLASDHIVARANSITGSVGVILQWAEITDLLKSLGVRVEEVKSGPLKANPSPFRPIDEAGRALAEEMVQESKDWFVGLVAKRRSLDPAAVPGLKEGRIYSGRKALDLKLVDEIGGEKAAVAWLEKERNIAKDLDIVDWEKSSDGSLGAVRTLARIVSAVTGIPVDTVVATLSRGLTIDAVQLDGLVSLWHPPESR